MNIRILRNGGYFETERRYLLKMETFFVLATIKILFNYDFSQEWKIWKMWKSGKDESGKIKGVAKKLPFHSWVIFTLVYGFFY